MKRIQSIDDLTPDSKNWAYIYLLRDPDTRQIRYVGKTTNPRVRLSGHLAQSGRGVTHCHRWVRKLKRMGKQPHIEIIEQVAADCWPERERHWIAYYRQKGEPLTNTAEGGLGASGHKHSLETRQKMSAYAKRIGRRIPNVEEGRRRAREFWLGRKRSPEECTKISRGRMGMRFSARHKQQLSDSRRAMFEQHPEVRDAISRSYGVLSDEEVLEVWWLAWEGNTSQAVLAKRFGIPQSTVSEIKHGKRYKHVKRPGLCYG